MEISDFEKKIEFLAKKYAKDPDDIEDFKQIGRIKVWNILEKMPDVAPQYIVTSIDREMLRVVKYYQAKKRKPEKGLLSLDAPIAIDDEGDERTLYDLIGEDDPLQLEETLLETLHKSIRNQWGGKYLERILREETRPREIVRKIVRAVIEDIEKIPIDTIPQTVDRRFFLERGLKRIFKAIYRESPSAIVMDAYKGQFQPWEFKQAPQGYWKGSRKMAHAKKAMRWFLEKMNIATMEDCERISHKDFKALKLDGLLQYVFDHSPYQALKSVFPDLKPWQMGKMPPNTFESRETRKEALLWYLERKGIPDISNMTPEEVFDTELKNVMTKKELDAAGLYTLLAHYDFSPYQVMEDFFPNQILPWTIRYAKKAWKGHQKETAAKAVKWLFEKYLKIPIDEIPQHATRALFYSVGFSGIISKKSLGFGHSSYLLVNNAYPGMFSEDLFQKGKKIKDRKSQRDYSTASSPPMTT